MFEIRLVFRNEIKSLKLKLKYFSIKIDVVLFSRYFVKSSYYFAK